jgi:hypothetical protein
MHVIFAVGGCLRMIDGFGECLSLCRVEIPASVEKIESKAFAGCTSLTEVIFAAGSHLKTISGFGKCTSLCRVEIPASVEAIQATAFAGCKALAEVIFPSDSHLRSLDGLRGCDSLIRLDLPASVEILRHPARSNFWGWCIPETVWSRELSFASGTRIKELSPSRGFRAFIDFANDHDLKKHRRRVHLRIPSPFTKIEP